VTLRVDGIQAAIAPGQRAPRRARPFGPSGNRWANGLIVLIPAFAHMLVGPRRLFAIELQFNELPDESLNPIRIYPTQ
jgi:hypothetical protein